MDDKEISKLIEQTKYCLHHYIHTRNSDNDLWINLCQRFYHMNSLMPIANTSRLRRMLEEMPDISAVKRCRRKIQADGMYLPTNPDVRRRRRISAEDWARYMAQKKHVDAVQSPQNTLSNTPPGYDSEGNAVGWADKSAERPRTFHE